MNSSFFAVRELIISCSIIGLLTACGGGGGGGGTPPADGGGATPTPQTSLTPDPVPTASVDPTPTPSSTDNPDPTETVVPTGPGTPTVMPTPTATVIVPTVTIVPTPTATVIVPTVTVEPTPTATVIVPTVTVEPTPTATVIVPTVTVVPTTSPDPVQVRVEAEDYENYFDVDAGNTGEAYRTDDVDIEGADGVYNVGWTATGEWLEYTVELNAGTYAVLTRVASDSGGGGLGISLDGEDVGSDEVGATGGWQTYQTHEVGTITVNGGFHTLRVDITGPNVNLDWIQFESAIDSDNDGVRDANDECPGTPADAVVNSSGCEIVTVDIEVTFANERLVGGPSSSQPGYTLYVFDNDLAAPGTSVCNGGCAGAWPPVLVDDGLASGVNGLSIIQRDDGSDQAAYNGRPLYFYAGDTSTETTAGEGVGGVWWIVPFGVLGDVEKLFNASTPQEPDTQEVTSNALITRFSDRPRTRHAREDQYQSYDHYIKFYFEDRSSNIEIIDYVAMGGTSVRMNVRTIWPLDDTEAENRWWYSGATTVASYCSNGTMDGPFTTVEDGVTYFNYWKEMDQNGCERRPIQLGDKLEFEISQFSAGGIPRGQENYYGTTFLYIVGEGIVPWYTDPTSTEHPEDSNKIPEEYWLGGKTSIHYQYTNEPNDHFLQMATNLGYYNAQKFLEGRRVHHSSAIDGMHDEDADNGSLTNQAGLAGSRYVNERCTECHERNGSAPVAPNFEALDRWVFKVGDENGNPHPQMGRVLQPSGPQGEGSVSIASWTQLANGLRTPNYEFSGTRPPTFSARIAPRLVGMGLLEAIDESQILALEDPDDLDGDGISGRANRVADPADPTITRIGRFGWKAATTSVRHQVAAALNGDMGVRTSLLPDPDCGSGQTCGADSPLMPEENLEKLVFYISTLGVRPQRVWKGGFEDTAVLNGGDIFNDIGCADCHTPTLQTSEFHPLAELRDQTIHPYSDMLLHDMGDGLADNLGEGQASGREWRTTPLWGIGLQACVTGGVINPIGGQGNEVCVPHHAYLHDGRATSIEDAILWHGGEGQASKDAYEALSGADQALVLRFLESL